MSFFNRQTQKNVSTGFVITEVNVDFVPGETRSDPIDGWGFTITDILIPADFLGTSITFEIAKDPAGPWKPALNITRQAISADVLADTYCVFAPIDFLGRKYVRVVSDATETNGPTLTVTLMSLK